MSDEQFKKMFALCDSDGCMERAAKQFVSQDQFGNEYIINLCKACQTKDSISSKLNKFIYSREHQGTVRNAGVFNKFLSRLFKVK